MTTKFARFWTCLASIVLAPCTLRAVDVVIVAHPATGLAPGDETMILKYQEGILDAHNFLKMLSKDKPRLVMANSAKDAPGGKACIVELEVPKTESVPHKGNNGVYTDFTAVQPFSVWYRSIEGAEPVLLGRGFYHGFATELEIIGMQKALSPADPQYMTSNLTVLNSRIVKKSAAQLQREALHNEFRMIMQLIPQTLAPNIVDATPHFNETPAHVLDFGKHLADFDRPKLPGSAPRSAKPVVNEQIHAAFKPSRVAKNADGAVVVEVALWNRLPVRAAGVISRVPSKAEQDWEKQMRASKKLTAELYRQRLKSRYVFNLAAGEKTTAQIFIPKGWFAEDPQPFRDSDLTAIVSGLGNHGKPPVADGHSE